MGTNNFESGKKAGKREDTTTQEDVVMSRYLDLRAQAYNSHMSAEERKAFAQNLVDTVNLLNRGEGIDSDVREDLLKQIHTIETQYTRLKEAAAAIHELERESRGGILVPHVYDKAVRLVREALESGVPASSLRPFENKIRDYLRRVRQRP